MTYTLRPHQEIAAHAAVEALRNGTASLPAAATIVMATGSGKTMTAWAVIDQLDARTVVVAAPTTTLVDQLAADAQRHAVGDVLRVSSKSTDRTATCDPDIIATHLNEPGTRIVITTYASLPVVAAAVRMSDGHVDVAVADEAHRTCGPKAGPAASMHQFPAARRLYMTATPRLYSSSDHNGASMDDETVFGPRVYDLDLATAIEAGIVADYRVVVAVVDRRTLSTLEHLAPHTDPRLVAGAVATVRAMREWDMRSVLSFHTLINRSKNFATLIGTVAADLSADQRPTGPGFAAWITGTTTPDTRARTLERLATTDGWAIVASARCLSEGVDVPNVDGIAFCDPKTSSVDVAQAVGRALRPKDGKVATIILPVLTDGETLDSAGTAIAGTVLRILRSHDRHLGARLDQLRRDLDPTYTTLDDRIVITVPDGVASAVAAKLRLDLVREATPAWEEMYGLLQRWASEHSHAAVPQSEVVDRCDGTPTSLGGWVANQRIIYRRGELSIDREAALESLHGWTWSPYDLQWEQMLHRYVTDTEHGADVRRWVNTQRASHRNATLDSERVARLEATPGWEWDPAVAEWEEQFAVVAQADGKLDLVGTATRAWAAHQRAAYRQGRLDIGRVSRLTTLPHWAWDTRRWETMYAALDKYIAEHGDAAVRRGYVAELDGVPVKLGEWVKRRREDKRHGRLDRDVEAHLSQLPGWCWQTDKRDGWEEIGEFLAVHGHTVVPQAHVTATGFHLGAWVQKRRATYDSGSLDADTVRQLEALPGWSWDPHGDAWERGFAAYTAFVTEHATTYVPSGHVDSGTFRVGQWCDTQRTLHKQGRLPPERHERLDRYGFIWSLQDAKWEHGYLTLVRHVTDTGALCANDHITPDSFRLGQWCVLQRRRYRIGTMPAERAARLEQLPDWTW
jgi:superfamily II DNA or RNA helicase